MSARRVLLLEDSADVAEPLLDALEARKVEAVHAATVAEAIAVYEPDLFDVIVVDYELPDGTGLDFLATIRGSDKALTIMFSGLDRTRELKAAGMSVDRQISKADPLALLAAVEGLE